MVVALLLLGLVSSVPAYAVFMPPDPGDQYIDRTDHLTYFNADTSTYYRAGSFSFDASGTLWVAHSGTDGSLLGRYDDGATTPTALFDLGERYVLSCDFGPDGLLYFTDPWNEQIVVFDPSTGGIVNTLTVPTFTSPHDVHVASDGDVFVSDSVLGRVARIASDASTSQVLPDPVPALTGVQGMGWDAEGNLLVGDGFLGGRVIRYSQGGSILGELDVSSMAVGPIRDIFVDTYGTMYVLGNDNTEPRFARRTAAGVNMGSFPDPAQGTLVSPTKLVVDNDGYAWVSSTPEADVTPGVVQRYTFAEGTPDTDAPSSSDNHFTGWVHGPAVVTITATDTGGSGVQSILYSLDDTTPSLITTGQVTVSAEGTTTLRYLAVDRAGNREPAHTVTVRVDNLAPVSSAVIDTTYYGPVSIDISSFDALSGVNHTYWRLNGGAWNDSRTIVVAAEERGDFGVEWYAVDGAGNAEFPVHEGFFRAYNRYEETSTPLVYRSTWASVPGPTWSGGAYARSTAATAAAYITFTGTTIELNGPTGPDMGKIGIRLDGGDMTEYDQYSAETTLTQLARFVASGAGTHVLAIESLGTHNPLSSGIAVGIDSVDIDGVLTNDVTAPVTTDDVTSAWYNAESLVTLTAADDSFVAATYFQVAEGPVRSYTAPFSIGASGLAVPLRYRSVDGASNSETTVTTSVKADVDDPHSSASIQPSYVDSATISLEASDTLSGVGSIEYNLDGAGWTTGDSVRVTGYGHHELLYRAVDVAGNVEAFHTGDVLVRRAAETYTITSPELRWQGQWDLWNTNAKRTHTSITSNYVTGYGRCTRIDVWAYKSPDSGIARLALDGSIAFVDLYSAVPTLTVVWSSGVLADTEHFLAYGSSGSRNEESSSRNVNFHSAVVEGVFGGVVDDTEPPTTTSNIPSEWRKSPWLVELSADDYLGHEGATFYDASMVQTDSPDATTVYEAPFPVSAEGTTYVSFYSEDTFGNRESLRTELLRLDSSAPTTTCDATATYTNSASIGLVAEDSLSGVASTHYRIDEAAWTTGTVVTLPAGNEGTHTVQWYSRDIVGNQEATSSVQFAVLKRYEEESQASIAQEGLNWGHDVQSGYSASIVRYAWGPGALVGTFTGDRFDLIATKRPTQGIARVLIDNVFVGTADQYSATDDYQQRVFSRAGLGAGSHNFRVEWTGEKNPESSGTDINVDAFELMGTMVSDLILPTSWATVDPAWRTTPQLISIEASDNGLVAPLIHYQIDGGTESLYSQAFDISAEGTTTLDWWATDGVNNEEDPRHHAIVRIDRTPPTVETSAPADWAAPSQTVFLTVADAGVGTDTVSYGLAGADPTTPYPLSGIEIATEGTTTVGYSAVDLLGNEATGNVTVRLDGTAPTSSCDATSGWRLPTEPVTLTAVDAHSGVGRIDYAVDTDVMQQYDTPFTISDEGTHTISYRATDRAGNRETTQTATVRIDGSSPVTAQDVPSQWSSATVNVHLTAADLYSGVAATYYSLDGGLPSTLATSVTPISAEGTTTLSYRSLDILGNTEPVSTKLVRIDRTVPHTTDNAPSDWSASPVTVSLTASDSASGVSGTWYRVNAGAVTTYTAGILVSVQGTTTIEYGSRDTAGNIETTETTSVRIDSSKPVTTSNAPVATQSRDVTVTLTATDVGSGVSRTYVRVGAGSVATYTAPVVVSSDGTTTVSFWSVDKAGNVETTKTANVVIDRTSPYIEGVITNLGAPVGNVVVTAYNAITNTSVKSVLTNAAGFYSMYLPAAGYKVRFSGTTPASLSQYYDHKTSITEATTVTLSVGKVTVSTDLGPTIAGRMVNQGAPLVGIVVTAFDATSHASIRSVLTTAGGNYAITGLPAGAYHVRFTGTVPASLSQYYDHKTTISDATTVTALGGVAAVSSDLGPTIQGTITNQGTPLANVLVTSYNATSYASIKSVLTNAAGFYTMPVAAGSYRIRFSNTTPASLSQYYDHRTTITSSTVVSATGGVINVSSDLGPTISGTLTDQGVPIAGAVVTSYNATSFASVKSAITNSAGYYQMSVPSGYYKVRFSVAAKPSLTQYYDHKSSITEATTLTALGGLVNVTSDLGPTIQGTVLNEGVPQVGVVVTSFVATSHTSVRSVVTNAAGFYTMSVPSGAYHLRFTGTTPASLTQYNDHMTTISDATTISAPAGLVAVSTDLGPVIRGTLTNGPTPLSGVLVTAYDATTHVSLRTVLTDALGNYSLSVPTGAYHVRFVVSAIPSLSQYYDHKSNITDASVVPASGGATTVSSDLGATP